jgi:acyl-coenzyme A synthetase/AMP-(fatty) acid ligase
VPLTPHSVGWPIVGSEVAVVSEEGRPCAIGEPGEVVARTIVPFLGTSGTARRRRRC